MPRSQLFLIALVAVMTMSAVPVLVKSTAANAYTIGIVRLGIAAAVFVPLVMLRGRLMKLQRDQWLRLLVIGIVFGLHWLTYFISIKLATATIAALAIITYSAQYLVLAYIFNGERVAPLEWLAVAACFVGCVMVSPSFSLADATFLGISVGLVSALLYAALPLLHQRATSVGTLERTWGQFFFALVVFLPLWGKADWQLSRVDVYQLLVLGLLCTVVSHGLWVKASTELPAIYTSMIYYLYLPGAVVGSVLFLGEQLTTQKLLGCGLVLGASAALSLYRYRRTRPAG